MRIELLLRCSMMMSDTYESSRLWSLIHHYSSHHIYNVYILGLGISRKMLIE